MPRPEHLTPARAAAVSALAVSVALLATACSSSKPKASATTSTASVAATSASSSPAADYTNLLIAPSDIPVDGVTRQSAAAPPQGAGVTALYADPSGTRKLGDTILVLSDASSASTAAHAAQQAAMSSLTGATSKASDVGTSGVVFSGTSNGGSTASTVLVFSEGRAYAVLEFDSAANDPVPAALVEQVGAKQDQLIKDKLPK